MSDQLPPSPRKMSGQLRVLLFGDQTADNGASIRNQLVAGRTNPLLCLFLDRVTLALRREVSELSPLDRRRIPLFSSIDELADRAGSQKNLYPGIDTALLCIFQLSQYFE